MLFSSMTEKNLKVEIDFFNFLTCVPLAFPSGIIVCAAVTKTTASSLATVQSKKQP